MGAAESRLGCCQPRQPHTIERVPRYKLKAPSELVLSPPLSPSVPPSADAASSASLGDVAGGVSDAPESSRSAQRDLCSSFELDDGPQTGVAENGAARSTRDTHAPTGSFGPDTSQDVSQASNDGGSTDAKLLGVYNSCAPDVSLLDTSEPSTLPGRPTDDAHVAALRSVMHRAQSAPGGATHLVQQGHGATSASTCTGSSAGVSTRSALKKAQSDRRRSGSQRILVTSEVETHEFVEEAAGAKRKPVKPKRRISDQLTPEEVHLLLKKKREYSMVEYQVREVIVTNPQSWAQIATNFATGQYESATPGMKQFLATLFTALRAGETTEQILDKLRIMHTAILRPEEVASGRIGDSSGASTQPQPAG